MNVPLVVVALALGWRALPTPGAVAAIATANGHPTDGAPPLLRSPRFLAATSAIALSNLAMYVTLLALPLLLSRRDGWTSEGIGLTLATISLAAFALSPYGGRLADRVGRRLPAACGLALLAAGLVPLALAPSSIGVAGLGAALLVMGVGLGLSTPALQVSAIEAVPVSAAGAASGVASTSRYAGSIAGSLLIAGPLAPAAAGAEGFGLLFAVLAGVAGASVLLALMLPSGVPRPAAVAPRADVRAA